MDKRTALHKAIEDLGGQIRAGAIIKRSQATISGYLKNGGRAPIDVCMRIEVATNGKHTAEMLRPDLADVIAAFRSRKAA
jgi:DNA-binding transcriptional regulator YdaS (Cro superfamily)